MAHVHPVVKVAAFSAHDGPVRCASLGAKSGQLLVTGGDDGHCNIWWLGRAARLAGFDAKSPVVAATFDRSEGSVAVGSHAGSVKLWDLERAGTDPSPTLALPSAHRSAVTAIAFHTVNERLLMTGGADGVVRLWDRRSSGEFTRFGGHSGGITVIKTLPHGRALIAGTSEGKLLFFDITAGRVSCELSAHRGSITGLDFHPVELVLASSSADQTSRFWSVEGLPPRLLSVSPSIPSPLAACHFVPPQTGAALAAVTSDGVRMLSFNGASAAGGAGAVAPFRTETLDAVDVPLGPAVACTWAGSNLRMAGAAAASSGSPPVHLLAASLSGSIVSVWSANLSRLAPLAPKALHPAFASRETVAAPPAAAVAAAVGGAGNAAGSGSRSSAAAAGAGASAHSPTRKAVGSPASAAAAPVSSPGAPDTAVAPPAPASAAASAAAVAPRVRVRVPVPVKSVSLTAAAVAPGEHRGEWHDVGQDAARLDDGDFQDHDYGHGHGHSNIDAAHRTSLRRADASDAKHDADVPLARAYVGFAASVRSPAEGKAASPRRTAGTAVVAAAPAAHHVATAAGGDDEGDEEGKYSEDDFEIEDEEEQDRGKQTLLPPSMSIRSPPGTARAPLQVDVPMPVPGSVGRLAHSPITAFDDDDDRGFAPPAAAAAEQVAVRHPAAQPAAKLDVAAPTVPTLKPATVASATAAAASAETSAQPQAQLSGRRGAAAAPNLASALAPALAMAEQAAAIAAAALAAAPTRRKSLSRPSRTDRDSGSGSGDSGASGSAAPAGLSASAGQHDQALISLHEASKPEPAAAAAAPVPMPAPVTVPASVAVPATRPPPQAFSAATATTAAADGESRGKGKGSNHGAAAAARSSGSSAAAAPRAPAPHPAPGHGHGDPFDGADGEVALPLVSATRHAPVGLDLAAFLPVNNARGFGASRVLPAASTAAALAASFRNPSSAGGAAKARPPLPLPGAAYPQQRPSTGEANRGRGRASAALPERQPSPPPPATEAQSASADARGGSPQQCLSRLPAAAAALRSLQREHGSTLRALRFRREELAAAASLWASGDVPAAVAVLRVAAHSDPAIGADFLRQFAFERCGGAVGLDAAEALLRLAGATLAAACSSSQPARALLATAPALSAAAVPPSFDGEAQPAPIASPASAAVAAFAATLRAFGTFIAATMASAAGAAVAGAATGRDAMAAGERDGEVGLAAEERARRCLTALRAFEAVRVDVQAAARMLTTLAAAGEAGARAEASRASEALQQYESWRSALPLHAVVAAARPSTAVAAAGGASSSGMPSP